MNDLVRRMTLRHLRLIVLLHDEGGVTRVARSLHITQPAVSKAVRELRALLDDRLFEIEADGMRWTTSGKIAVQSARAVLRNLEDLQRQTDLVRMGRHESFSIGSTRMAEAAISSSIPVHLARAGIKVELHRGTSDQMLKALENREIDIAFGRCDTGWRRAGFEYVPIYRDRFVIVCGRRNPIARKRRVSFDELSRQYWVLPPRGTYVHHLVEQAFLSQNAAPPTAAVISNLGLNDLRMVEQDNFLALFPETEAVELAQRGTVRIVDGLDAEYREVGAILLRDQPRHPAVDLAIQFIRDFTQTRAAA